MPFFTCEATTSVAADGSISYSVTHLCEINITTIKDAYYVGTAEDFATEVYYGGTIVPTADITLTAVFVPVTPEKFDVIFLDPPYEFKYEEKRIKKATNHLNNEIYIHDLDHYVVGSHNCLSIPFDDLLEKGFNTRQTDVRPAQSISTAFQLVAVIFQLLPVIHREEPSVSVRQFQRGDLIGLDRKQPEGVVRQSAPIVSADIRQMGQADQYNDQKSDYFQLFHGEPPCSLFFSLYHILRLLSSG